MAVDSLGLDIKSLQQAGDLSTWEGGLFASTSDEAAVQVCVGMAPFLQGAIMLGVCRTPNLMYC